MTRPEPPPPGRAAAHPGTCDPGLLRAIPRSLGRAELGITGAPPFTGVDLWTAYELSWLDPFGRPRVAIAALAVPAGSANLVESKSLKLYLNSFSQTPIPGAAEVRDTIARDLEAACGARVDVRLRLPADFARERLSDLEGECVDDEGVVISAYTPDPGLLAAGGPTVEEALVSRLLKTNCPLTGQPDWADVRIHYRGPRLDRPGLLRYLVSFRRHADFHEHCVERIFMDLLDRCRPEALTVHARYTRRGGIDINPFRTNCGEVPPPGVRTARQ